MRFPRATRLDQVLSVTEDADEGIFSAGEQAPQRAATHALDHGLGELFESAEAVRERRPAKMLLTALRIDLDVQTRLAAVAAARGRGPRR